MSRRIPKSVQFGLGAGGIAVAFTSATGAVWWEAALLVGSIVSVANSVHGEDANE